MKALYLSLLLALGLTACKTAPVVVVEHQLAPPTQKQESIDKKQQQPVIALVLGSGGARGYAHIGVLEELEKYGIQPHLIVGTSAGSLAGVLYASGKSAQEIRLLAENMKINEIKEYDLGSQSIFDGQKIEDYVNKQINHQPLEKFPIPMYVVATQLDNGKLTVFNHGNAGQAVRASIAIPTMFAPVKIEGKSYVDGGLASPVPVKIAQQLGADLIIAVDILAQPQHTKTDTMWGLFNQNINIMQYHLAREELKGADVVIRPDLREKSHIFDDKSRQQTIEAGQLATQTQIAIIQQKIQQLYVAYAERLQRD